jgi:hypothetical protein
MRLNFNIDKAIATAAYLIDREGGEIDMFPLIKKLYYSDRSALVAWGDSVTGDSFASLEKGPIVSTIYNLMKGTGTATNLIKWNNAIQRTPPHKISIRKQPGQGILSDREIEIIEASRLKIDSIDGSIADWLHLNCPEWENPGQSSKPIDPGTILRKEKIPEERILQIESENEEIRFMEALLSAG